jgi:hypothetical protein
MRVSALVPYSSGRTRLRWLLAAVAVSAALVVGLVTLTGRAGAATTATWNRLAGCESGGDWHINTGNGYYGGLQFSEPTWIAMGGRAYAQRPDLATPAEQMAVGQNLLRASHWSWGAWPVCSRRLGLTEAEAKAMDTSVDGRFVHGPIYTPDPPLKPREPLRKLAVG